jgi:hypothetical protein
MTAATARADAPFHLRVLADAVIIMASIYVIGLIVFWFVPETAGKVLPA